MSNVKSTNPKGADEFGFDTGNVNSHYHRSTSAGDYLFKHDRPTEKQQPMFIERDVVTQQTKSPTPSLSQPMKSQNGTTCHSPTYQNKTYLTQQQRQVQSKISDIELLWRHYRGYDVMF